MTRNLIISATLAAALGMGACTDMTASQQSTLEGAGIGTAAGVIVGAATGDWAWAAAGAVVGAGTGYIVNQQEQKQKAAQQSAYNEGVQAGKQQAPKN